MVSAGYQAEDTFGKAEFAIPVFVGTNEYAYLSNWSRVINSVHGGVFNFFTQLNAYSPNPAQPGTIRVGLSQSPYGLNPYAIKTPWELAIVRTIYDSLSATDPLLSSQLMNWMIVSSQQVSNDNLGYTPPSGTASTYRYSLRGDLFFQNDNSGSHPASRVTSWDVAFSYLSLLGTGAFQSVGASSLTGVTIISSTTFDLNIGGGPFTPFALESLTILPGQYWIGGPPDQWNSAFTKTLSTCTQLSGSAVAACYRAQYTLSPTMKIGSSSIPAVVCNATSSVGGSGTGCAYFTGSLMSADPNKVAPTYDPVANHILIGSGPWECTDTTVVGSGCTPCGAAICFPSIYTLQRFGSGTSPGNGLSDHYFRSNGNLALWIWSGDNGDFTHDFGVLQTVRSCFGVPVGTSGCTHWQEGIGGGGDGVTCCVVTSVQVSIVNRFVSVNWVGPFAWNASPPLGLAALSPVLYEGSAPTLNPASLVGCAYAYPTGGYDC
jgi:hypothetical protein